MKIWDYSSGKFALSGQLKAGLFMGDYSMAGINSMFNTGTIIGNCCNIFGTGYPRTFIPSFSWGGSNGFTTYDPAKAFASIESMMNIHGQTFKPEDRLLLLKVYEETTKFRHWESKEDMEKKLLKSQPA